MVACKSCQGNGQAWGVLVNSPLVFYVEWTIVLGSLGYFKLVYTPIPRLDFIIQKSKPLTQEILSQTP